MKYLNKTSGSIRLAALLSGAAVLGLVSQSALAAGTAVGTPITNSATLTYSVATVVQPTITGTSTAFVVDSKINLTVAPAATTNVVPGATAQVLTFTVTNNANTILDFDLALQLPLAGHQFAATGCNAYVESGATAGYQAAQDTAIFIDELAADATKTVYAVCNIPGTVINSNIAHVDLVATAKGTFTSGGINNYTATAGVLGAALTQTAGADTPGIVDIVFADVAGTALSPADAARDATHSDGGHYSVTAAVMTVSKTAALLCDPFNGVTDPKNIPGAMTQWTITISNGAGGAAATLTSITDTLSANVAHDPGAAAALTVPTNAATCVAGAGTKGFKVTTSAARAISSTCAATTTCYFTSANDSDGVDNNAGAITATFGADLLPADGGHASAGLLNAGESVSIIFNTVIQ